MNARLLGHEVDFLWPQAKLVVETDGFRAHCGREAFEHDRRRAARLATAGYEVIRFTWRQLLDEHEDIVAVLRSRLTPRLAADPPR